MLAVKKAAQMLRCSQKEMALIQKAAKLDHRSVNQFLLTAAIERAEKVLAPRKPAPYSDQQEASA